MRQDPASIDRVASFPALLRATTRASAGKRLSPPAELFLVDREREVLELHRELEDGSYRPRPFKTFRICDPKPRLICAAEFRDRVVQHALMAVMEPALERLAIEDSYACRRGKGVHAAITRAQELSRRFPYALVLDVYHYFETIDHHVLRDLLARRFSDRRLLDLAACFVDPGVPGAPPGKGLPIGHLTSQHFANAYLAPLDRAIKQDLRVKGYVRYMDDLLLFSDERATLARWREAVAQRIEALELRLRGDVSRTVAVSSGVPFLGRVIWPRAIRLSPKAKARTLRKLALLERRHLRGLIDDAQLERSAASLFAHLSSADTRALRRSIVERGAPTGAPSGGPKTRARPLGGRG